MLAQKLVPTNKLPSISTIDRIYRRVVVVARVFGVHNRQNDDTGKVAKPRQSQFGQWAKSVR